jgi:parallel beta-helix repeat protein
MLGSDMARLRKTISVTTIIFTLLFSATAVTSYVRFACAQTDRFLTKVENVTVKNLIIKGGQFGVYLNRCSNITVSNNTITGVSYPYPPSGTGGIFVWGGDHHIIVGNRLENNYHGIYLGYGVEYCTISGNNITGNSKGIVLSSISSNNIIYHNNFINNTLHVDDYGDTPSLNAWDNGKEGNFWSDYNGTDANSDGIGDTPYEVDSNNKDRYPLMKPWDPTKPVDTAPPLISVSSPQNKVYNDSSVSLTFSTNEPASQMSYSLDGQDKVTIAGNTTVSGLQNGSHNLTVYVTDKYGNTGTSETIYFTVEVSEPFPTTLVIVSLTSVAVAIVGLLVYFKKRKH